MASISSNFLPWSSKHTKPPLSHLINSKWTRRLPETCRRTNATRSAHLLLVFQSGVCAAPRRAHGRQGGRQSAEGSGGVEAAEGLGVLLGSPLPV